MNWRISLAALSFSALFCASGIATQGAQVKDVYTGLRSMALAMRPQTAGVSRSAPATMPYGVLMDMRIRDDFATVVAASNGNASIYFSTGGGHIGGEGVPSIAAAAKAAVEAAAPCLHVAHVTKRFPLPEPGYVNFYILTPGGVLTATAKEPALQDTKKPLGHLFDAMQNVITQYRLSAQ